MAWDVTTGKDEARPNANKRMSGCKHSGSDAMNGNNLSKEASKHEPFERGLYSSQSRQVLA